MKKLTTLFFIALTFLSINSHANCPEGSFLITEYDNDLSDSDLIRSRELNRLARSSRLFLYATKEYSPRLDRFKDGSEDNEYSIPMEKFGMNPNSYALHNLGYRFRTDFGIVISKNVFFNYLDREEPIVIEEGEKIWVTSFSEIEKANEYEYDTTYRFRTYTHKILNSVLYSAGSLQRSFANDYGHYPLLICVKE